jgi:hypothetical protein
VNSLSLSVLNGARSTVEFMFAKTKKNSKLNNNLNIYFFKST